MLSSFLLCISEKIVIITIRNIITILGCYMILHLLKIILKGSGSSGNFGHLGRPGVRGGSGPGMNGIAANYTSILHQVGKDLNIDDVRKFKSMSFDQQMELATKDRAEFDRLKEVTDNFKKFKFSDSDSVTTLLSPTNAKLILNRMSDPVLSQKELSKSPTKDNYQSWFYQKYGVVAEDLSGSNAKRYGEALDAIDERHGVVGGFFIKGVDTAWQRAGERGGEFDSAYGVIRVPTRLQGGGQDQDAKDVLNHEYAHYLDAYVLGSPNITTKQLKGSGKNTQ